MQTRLGMAKLSTESFGYSGTRRFSYEFPAVFSPARVRSWWWTRPGVEAQTVANVHLALKQGSIRVRDHKIDLPNADIPTVKTARGYLANSGRRSHPGHAKRGSELGEILEGINPPIPPPPTLEDERLRTRFDSCLNLPAGHRHARVFSAISSPVKRDPVIIPSRISPIPIRFCAGQDGFRRRNRKNILELLFDRGISALGRSILLITARY